MGTQRNERSCLIRMIRKNFIVEDISGNKPIKDVIRSKDE